MKVSPRSVGQYAARQSSLKHRTSCDWEDVHALTAMRAHPVAMGSSVLCLSEGQGIILNTCSVLAAELLCQQQKPYISSNGKYQVGELRSPSIEASQKCRRNTSPPASLHSSSGTPTIMHGRVRKAKKLIGRLEQRKPTAVVCTLNAPQRPRRLGDEAMVLSRAVKPLANGA